MKNFKRNIILFLSPFLLGILILFSVPVNKEFAYNFVKGECNNKASWIYSRIFENPKSIDIAFSGASQTGCAIMDSYIEENLQINTGEKHHVVNLGYCRRGRDIQFAMLKDLFEHKKPKILIIEVAEDEPKKSHPVFPYLVGTNDLFGSATFLNQRYFSSLFKGLIVRYEHLKWYLFSNKTNSTSTSDFSYNSSPQVTSTENIAANQATWEKRLSKKSFELQRKIELNYSKHYLLKITQLAKDNNCQLLFLYLPESGSKLNTPLLYDFYSDLAPVILPSANTIKESNNWMDAMHFNDNGAKEISNTLVDILTDYLCSQN